MATLDSSPATAEQEEAVNLAYEFVRPSYEHLIQRRETIESRARTFMIFATTGMLAALTLASTAFGKPDLSSPWLLAAGACYTLIVLAGLTAQVGGRVTTVDLSIMVEDWLKLSALEFKRYMLVHAAETARLKAPILNRKGYMADFIGCLLIAQVGFLVLWVLDLALQPHL